MSAETIPLEDALDRELAALTKQQLAAIHGRTAASGASAGARPPLERKSAGHSRQTFQFICKFGRRLRHLVTRA